MVSSPYPSLSAPQHRTPPVRLVQSPAEVRWRGCLRGRGPPYLTASGEVLKGIFLLYCASETKAAASRRSWGKGENTDSWSVGVGADTHSQELPLTPRSGTRDAAASHTRLPRSASEDPSPSQPGDGTPRTALATCEAPSAMARTDRQTLRLPGPAAFNGARPRSGGSGRRCRSWSRLTGNGVGGAAAAGRALGAAGRLRGRGASGLAGGPCPPPVPPLAPAPPAAPSRCRPGAAGGGLRRGERSSVRPRSPSASFPALAEGLGGQHDPPVVSSSSLGLGGRWVSRNGFAPCAAVGASLEKGW